ncbi:MAG: sensor histidine kinase [Bacteroidales bacterium]
MQQFLLYVLLQHSLPKIIVQNCRLIWLLFCLLPYVLAAQNPYSLLFTKQNGLPSNSVYDLHESKNGFIWIAGEHGIARYDGFEYKVYTNPKQKSKSGASIKEDKYGRIWYATFDGFFYYVEHDSLKAANLSTSASSYDYGLIDDALIYLENGTLIYYDIVAQKKNKELKLPQSPQNKGYAGLWQAGTYLYVLDIGTYLVRIDKNGQITPVAKSSELWEKSFKLSVTNRGDGLLILPHQEEKELTLFSISSHQTLQKQFIPTKNFSPQAIRCDKEGNVWLLGTQGGIVINTKGEFIYSSSPLFPTYSLSCVLKDREGNHWIGTTNEGLLFVPNIRTYIYQQPDFKPYRLALMKGKLYIGTKYDELFTTTFAQKEPQFLLKNKERHEIYVLYADTMSQQLYSTSHKCRKINTAGKVVSLKGGAVKDYERIDPKYIAESSTGSFGLLLKPSSFSAPSLWDSIYQANIQMFGSEEAGIFNKEYCRAKALAFLPKEKVLFFASNIGLYKVTPNSIKEGLYQGEKVYMNMLESYQSIAYGLTNTNGLFQITANGKLSPISVENLALQRIKVCEHFLFIWAEKQLLFADLQKDSLHFQKLDASIPADEINDILCWHEELVIATDAGLLYKKWQDAQTIKELPLFRINQMKVNNLLYFPNDLIRLPYHENNVEINYSLLSFRPYTDKALFYRINNKGEWQPAPKESRTLKLAALAPDAYEVDFRLGDREDSPIQGIQFVILPPFWKTTWFWVLISGAIAGLATLFFLSRTNLLKKQNDLLVEKLALESDLRASLVEKLKLEGDLRASLLSSIKSQMNPHFFFNALNTIQSFIFSDDKRSAASYLGKFARLMRMVLEMSAKEQVTLQEEIDALKMYLELENTRFNQSLDYTIEVAAPLDTANLYIPSMIIQPYIENAVKHGLLHIKGEKKLRVFIHQEANCLKVRIEDNGIGRKRSAELNKIKQEKHHSFATDANLKRIELLNKENPMIGVEYVDKEDENHRAQGTLVLITLPVMLTKKPFEGLQPLER